MAEFDLYNIKTWKEAVVWINDYGEWKKAIPYYNDNGTWIDLRSSANAYFLYTLTEQGLIRKLDLSNNSIWKVKVFPPNAMCPDTNGSLYVIHSGNQIAKLGSVGNVVWNTVINDTTLNNIQITSDSKVYAGGENRTLYKLNSSSGNILNTIDLGYKINALSISEDYIYCGTDDDKLYKLNTSDDTIWDREIDFKIKHIQSSKDVIYIATDTNNILLYDINGNFLWIYDTHDTINNVAIDPIRNYLFIACRNKILILDSYMRERLTKQIGAKSIAPDVNGNFFIALDNINTNGYYSYTLLKCDSRGNVLWATSDENSSIISMTVEIDSNFTETINVPPTMAEAPGYFVYIATKDNRYVKLDLEHNEILTLNYNNITEILPDGKGNQYVIYDTNKITKVDKDGNAVWDEDITLNLGSLTGAVDKYFNLYVGGTDSRLYKILPDGNIFELNDFISGRMNRLKVSLDNYIYGVTDNGVVYKIDTNGNIIWTTQLTTTQAISINVFEDKDIYIGTLEPKIARLNSAGNVVWEIDTEYAATDIVIENTGLYIYAALPNKTLKIHNTGNIVTNYNVPGANRLAIDYLNYVYLSRNTNGIVYKIHPSGGVVWSYTVDDEPFNHIAIGN